METVWFRDWSAALPSGSGDAIHLTGMRHETDSGGVRSVTLFGVSTAAASVKVHIESEGGAQEKTVSLAGLQRFAVDFQLPASDRDLLITAANTGTGLTGYDRAVHRFGIAGSVELDSPTILAGSSDFSGYTAGIPDRIQYSRTFVKLNPSPAWVEKLGSIAFGSGDEYFHVASINEASKKEIAKLFKSYRRGDLSLAEYESELGRLVKTNFHRQMTHLPTETIAKWKDYYNKLKAFEAGLDAEDAKTARRIVTGKKSRLGNHGSADPFSIATSFAPSAAMMYPVRPGDLGLVKADDPAAAFEDFVDEAMRYWKAHARLGVLFHERTRTRPTRLVLGEPIYQLALTPGEEVQIRQVAETRRKTAFSEVTDQTSEKESVFSSTWSTDMASTISSQQSFQSTATIGGGASGTVPIPEVPVGVSTQVSASSSSADSESTEDSVSTRRQRVETQTARMRQQHRIQIDIATEDNQSLGTTRTLRNHNQQRSVMHTFHKVYRKEQISLERYGASLCLRLEVDDPARETRALFNANLSKIEPATVAPKNIMPPVPEISHEVRKWVYPTDGDGGPFHGWRVDRWKTKTWDLKTLAGTDGYVLSEPPRFVMTECRLAFYANPLHSLDPDPDFDPDIVPLNETTETVPNVWVGWSFARNGGCVRWLEEPRLDSDNPIARLKFSLPLFYTAPGILGEKEMEIVRIRFRIETKWRPSDATHAEYFAKVHAEELRLAAEFDPRQVFQLHEIAVASYPSTLLNRALFEGLQLSGGQANPVVCSIFDLDGVFIENSPYWTSPSGRENYDSIAVRLQRLPAQFPLHELLTDDLVASHAIVYVPIKAGMEEAALAMLKEAASEASTIAADFRRFREGAFGPLADPAIPNVEAHLGPNPVPVTPAGAPDWEQPWEKPQRKFRILGQWSDLVPTDGVHVESHLSATVVTDENEVYRLERLAAKEE
ncbi:hypothetical protein A1507_19550 [Methylomonas koyamae]|uniref:Uncharacterized protein n=1 Tax=Methylomonas koyamae TaxID=702114 RepID=A0A177N2M6_9GAMM|nr:hypothetical protein [Methylomonas koyamae]OAI11904.1 hypothetical protein A1507_19550 [Methylomonas koyamae]